MSRATPLLCRAVELAVPLLLNAVVLPAQAQMATATSTEPRSFYEDRRAHRPGDMLTVVITEMSSVSATAQTTLNKSESTQASVLDRTRALRQLGAGIDSKAAGGGAVERSDKLVANLTVVVTSVDEHGNLKVHGEQEIQVNNERQKIRLDGTVRSEDISPENTVSSSRVALAQIEFTGKGILARKQSPGLLTRILSWFWE